MALIKPTITSCIDGKDHGWLIVNEETDEAGGHWEYRWCQKCGALTQVTYNDQGQPVAVMNDDQTHFIMIPKVLNAVIR